MKHQILSKIDALCMLIFKIIDLQQILPEGARRHNFSRCEELVLLTHLQFDGRSLIND